MATSQPSQGIVLMPAKFKTKHYTILLPNELAERVARVPKGEGGWQAFMAGVRAHLKGATLTLPEPLLRQMIDKAASDVSGGFQNTLRWVICCALAQHTEALLGEAKGGLKGTPKGGAV